MKILETHPNTSKYYLLSELLNNISRKGVITSIVLYLTSDVLNYNRQDSFGIYGVIAGILIVSPIVGALFGDLFIGGKKATIYGAIIQGVGILSIGIGTNLFFFIGISLFVIGSSLYKYNLMANYSREYNDKKILLDSAFTIFLVISIIVQLTYKIFIPESFTLLFIVFGLLSIVSIVPIIKIKVHQNSKLITESKYSFIVLAFVGLIIYNLSSKYFNLQLDNVLYSTEIRPHELNSFGVYFTLFFGILFGIYRTYYNKKSSYRIIIGISVALVVAIIAYFSKTIEFEGQLLLMILAMILLNISWLYITPMTMSIISKNISNKYRAFGLSLISIPAQIVFYFISYVMLNK